MNLKTKCKHCGFTFGSHHGGTSPWPFNYCPGHEGRMDWENGQGTTFEKEEDHIDTDDYKTDHIPTPSDEEAIKAGTFGVTYKIMKGRDKRI